MWLQRRKRLMETVDRVEPGVADQVVQAPAVLRFVHRDIVTAGLQLAGDTAQEVRVAMIPVGPQRVAEDHDAHATVSDRPSSAV
jgi:hypothetical protein